MDDAATVRAAGRLGLQQPLRARRRQDRRRRQRLLADRAPTAGAGVLPGRLHGATVFRPVLHVLFRSTWTITATAPPPWACCGTIGVVFEVGVCSSPSARFFRRYDASWMLLIACQFLPALGRDRTVPGKPAGDAAGAERARAGLCGVLRSSDADAGDLLPRSPQWAWPGAAVRILVRVSAVCSAHSLPANCGRSTMVAPRSWPGSGFALIGALLCFFALSLPLIRARRNSRVR